MGKMIDLTNQTFGKLTVLENAGKLDGRRYFWKCRCECGNTTIVLGTLLRNGNTKSCGCGKFDGLKKYNLEQSEKNKIKIGTRFGKLVVIEDLGFRTQVPGHQRRWYKCKCDCGNEIEVMGNSLKFNHNSSCGKCNYSSLGEELIFQLLTNNNYNFEYNITFPELVKETGRKLRFDFIIYDDDFKTPIRFVEYDGRQHTLGPDTAIWPSADSLESIQERDQIKNQFCLKKGYPLVRIPYTKKQISLNDIFSNKYLIKGDDLK